MIGGSDRNRKQQITLNAGLIAVLLVLSAVAGWAQQAQYVHDVTHPGGLTRLVVAAPELVQVEENYWMRPAGRFQLWSGSSVPTGGNPMRPGDESRIICSQEYLSTNGFYAFTSRIQFSIDNTVVSSAQVKPAQQDDEEEEEEEPEDEAKYVDIHELMEAAATAASAGDLENYWLSPLVSGRRDVQGTARIPLNADTASEATRFLEVYHHFTLIHDMLLVELIITNTSNTEHLVGTRIIFDTGFGGVSIYDGQPIFLPDGTMIESERVFPDPQDPSATMPASWVTYDNLDNPVLALKGVVEGTEVHNPGWANEAAGLPDAIEFGTFGRIGASWFDFVPNLFTPITDEDWAYAVKWEEKRLAPGQSRRYVTYLGLGVASADYDPPFAVAGYGPYKLIQREGDDPATPDVTEEYYLADQDGQSPFPVALYVDNFSPSVLSNATATIDLPPGLELWPSTQARTKSLGLIGRNELAGATWTVRASGARPGLAEIKLTGPRGKTVRRKIYIPALPIFIPQPSVTGLEMISIPYEFTNNDPEHVFASLGSLLSGGSAALIRWDPYSLRYCWFPDLFVTSVSPGLGYWLLNQAAVTVRLPADAQSISLSQIYSVSLSRGWNQIGSPFTISVRFDTLRVIGPYGQEWTLLEAIARDLLQPTIFSFNPQTNEYEWEMALSRIHLDPYMGYWLLAKDDITLVFPPPTVLMPMQQRESRELAALEEGWQVELVVTGAGVRRAGRAFGVSPNSAPGFDRTDVPSPPLPLTEGPSLQAEFINSQSSQPPCLVDMRPADGTENTWELAITTNARDQDIVLSWPNLATLPGSLTAVLQDAATGQCRYMRTTSSYHYNSGDGGRRVFRITVQPKDDSGPTVTEVQATAAPQGNWVISYTLSAPASVKIQIRNISGVVVKRLQQDQIAMAGRNTTLWNGRSDQGTVIPAGRYLCEITAQSPDTGQVSRVVTTMAVVR